MGKVIVKNDEPINGRNTRKIFMGIGKGDGNTYFAEAVLIGDYSETEAYLTRKHDVSEVWSFRKGHEVTLYGIFRNNGLRFISGTVLNKIHSYKN